MTVERGPGTLYEFYDAREEPLEQVASWTDAARKIREITDDVLRIAVSTAPQGRARDDQFEQLQFSHRKGGTSFAGRYKYRQAVINTARHAAWVHMGTGGGGDRLSKGMVEGEGLGPVFFGVGPGFLHRIHGTTPERAPERRESPVTQAVWDAYPSFVYFLQYQWKGQEPQPWLANAGRAAYRLPGNH